jgi:hypothetical protein
MKTFGHPKAQHSAPPSKRVLDFDGLREKGIHYHPNHLRRLWQRGDFPAPFKPSPRKLAWWEDAIDAWLVSKTTEA